MIQCLYLLLGQFLPWSLGFKGVEGHQILVFTDFELFKGFALLNMQVIINLDAVLFSFLSFASDFRKKSLVFSLVLKLEYGSHVVILFAQNWVIELWFRSENNIISLGSGLGVDLRVDLVFYTLDAVIPLH